MAAPVITDYVDGLLKRVYSDDVTDWFMNTNAEFWNKLQSAKLEPVGIGDGLYVPQKFASPQNISTPAESGAVPTVKPAVVKQGRIRLAQFIGQIETSLLLDAVGTGAGAWKSVIKTEMDACLTDLTKHVNRSVCSQTGSGVLFTVNATAATSTTAVGKLPYGSLLVHEPMRLEQYTAASGGTIVGTAFQVSKVVDSTRTITVDSVQDFTADQVLVLEGSYGTSSNGLPGLIDDGTNLTTVQNLSRDTYEQLKAAVLGNSGTVRDLTEDLLIRGSLETFQKSGARVNLLAMNSGQLEKYLAFMRPDRRITTTGSGAPKYDSGFQEGIGFFNAGVRAEVFVSTDISPRTVYGITTDRLRRVGDSKIGWLSVNKNGDIFQQGIASGGYKLTKCATLKLFSNIANFQCNAHFRIDDLSDAQLCGATRGGTDV